MIKLRPRPTEVPVTLTSDKVKATMKRIKAKVEGGVELKSGDFESHWLRDDVRLTLWKSQQKKCCYCERKRDAKREPDIEHYRPKTKVEGVGRPGYWWLAYSWENLLFCCKACNQTKLAKFPLMGGRRARKSTDDLGEESPVVPNPETEDPEELISYDWEFGPPEMAYPVGKDSAGRGRRAIEVLGLRRTELAEERGRLLLSLRGIAGKMQAALHYERPRLQQRAAREIERETRADNAHAGFRRAFFRKVGLGDYVAKD